jgi:hypothetical protein
MARLVNAIFDQADITESCLWETQRAGWSIKGVICESVYWDEERKEKILYGPGEFEQLFAEKIRIRLFYKDGITPLEIVTLPSLIKHLHGSHYGCSLRLDSIHDGAGGVVVELAIENPCERSIEELKRIKVALEVEAQQKVEYQRQALTERETRLQLEGEVRRLDLVVDKLISRPTLHQGDSYHMSDTYNVSGQAGAVGPNAQAHDMVFNQIVHQVEQSVDLAALAKELSELRQAIMEKRDSSPQAAVALGEIAKAEIAAQEKNGSKLVEHRKAAGKWALDFAKEIGKDLVVETIKQSMGMQ